MDIYYHRKNSKRLFFGYRPATIALVLFIAVLQIGLISDAGSLFPVSTSGFGSLQYAFAVTSDDVVLETFPKNPVKDQPISVSATIPTDQILIERSTLLFTVKDNSVPVTVVMTIETSERKTIFKGTIPPQAEGTLVTYSVTLELSTQSPIRSKTMSFVVRNDDDRPQVSLPKFDPPTPTLIDDVLVRYNISDNGGIAKDPTLAYCLDFKDRCQDPSKWTSVRMREIQNKGPTYYAIIPAPELGTLGPLGDKSILKPMNLLERSTRMKIAINVTDLSGNTYESNLESLNGFKYSEVLKLSSTIHIMSFDIKEQKLKTTYEILDAGRTLLSREMELIASSERSKPFDFPSDSYHFPISEMVPYEIKPVYCTILGKDISEMDSARCKEFRWEPLKLKKYVGLPPTIPLFVVSDINQFDADGYSGTHVRFEETTLSFNSSLTIKRNTLYSAQIYAPLMGSFALLGATFLVSNKDHLRSMLAVVIGIFAFIVAFIPIYNQQKSTTEITTADMLIFSLLIGTFVYTISLILVQRRDSDIYKLGALIITIIIIIIFPFLSRELTYGLPISILSALILGGFYILELRFKKKRSLSKQ